MPVLFTAPQATIIINMCKSDFLQLMCFSYSLPLSIFQTTKLLATQNCSKEAQEWFGTTVFLYFCADREIRRSLSLSLFPYCSLNVSKILFHLFLHVLTHVLHPNWLLTFSIIFFHAVSPAQNTLSLQHLHRLCEQVLLSFDNTGLIFLRRFNFESLEWEKCENIHVF